MQHAARDSLPTAPGECGSEMREFHCPLLQGRDAMFQALAGPGGTMVGALRNCNGSPSIRCHIAWGQWAVHLLRNSATPHCLGALGSRIPAIHRHTARGQWAVDFLRHTAAVLGGSGK